MVQQDLRGAAHGVALEGIERFRVLFLGDHVGFHRFDLVVAEDGGDGDPALEIEDELLLLRHRHGVGMSVGMRSHGVSSLLNAEIALALGCSRGYVHEFTHVVGEPNLRFRMPGCHCPATQCRSKRAKVRRWCAT